MKLLSTRGRLGRSGSGSDIAILEALEQRTLLAVSLSADGWTTFTLPNDGRAVYVSTSMGDDANDGLSDQSPVVSLSRARSLLRDGRGDWMLLKAGDVWRAALTGWWHSGKNANEPILISSYGRGERPVLETQTWPGFTTSKEVKHIAIVGIHFESNLRNPLSPDFVGTNGGDFGFRAVHPIHNVLIENCVFNSYKINVMVQGFYGDSSNLKVRRSIITDSYSTNSHSQGLYVANVRGVLLEDNVFDHNGWNEHIPAAKATVFNHNVYLSEKTWDVVARGNTFANAGSHGLQARGGGLIQDNLFIRNPIGLLFGIGHVLQPGGTSGQVTGNVFLGTGNINGSARGWALEIGNTKPGGKTIVSNNIFAHDNQRNYPAIRLVAGQGVTNPEQGSGLHDLRIENNIIYRWHKGLSVDRHLYAGGSGFNSMSGVVIRNNDFQSIFDGQMVHQPRMPESLGQQWSNNKYDLPSDSSQWFHVAGNTLSLTDWRSNVESSAQRSHVAYYAPDRTVESYNASLGGRATVGSFLTQARLQAQRYWRPQYTANAVMDYVREGFSNKVIPPTVTATNLTSTNTQPTRERITLFFSMDVSQSLKVSDLVIRDRRTGERIDPSRMRMEYDREHNRATWTFPGLRGGVLPRGDYTVILPHQIVWDGWGSTLDGNGDGKLGTDFWRRLRIR